ncbi:MAG TPA: pyruvate dehydrogenase complex dihydrolipoamide acetyltransferase [Patescibacteria group bacterium]|nr:pyruvate dehydrogenase complex dihydrolipoamide acetyltransferase [Patescibacteria group bacterium]
MPIQILMPALSPTMAEGNLARWLKKEGDTVKAGDVLAEIETDKATMEFEATDEGILGKILVPDGTQGVKVNQLIGLILEEGEDASALTAAGAAGAVNLGGVAAPVTPVATKPTPVTAAATATATAPGTRIFATPLAKRIAKDAGIELAQLAGSGPHGRIVKHDVEQAISSGVTKPAAAAPVAAAAPAKAAPAPVPEFGPAYTEVPLTSMRKVIAKRLTEAKQTVPHFYLTVDIELDKLLALRADLNGRSDAYKLSVNDFIIRAVALGLKKVPAANASFTETAIRLYTDVDISVAVATPAGLITPIIKHADQKGLAAISGEMKTLAVKARDGKLKPEEFQGGGFTISNLGMFGVRDFAAIINPPQGCILAVGAGEQRAVVKDNALAIATVMSCTLSVDHRVVDGAIGAEFLAAFKKLIEEPLTMLL